MANLGAEIFLTLGNIDAAVNRAMGDVNTTDPVDGAFGLGAVALIVLLSPSERPERRARYGLVQTEPDV